MAAAEKHGIPANKDVNRDAQEGVGLAQVYPRNGRRWSNGDAYLRPAAARSNLTVETGAQATRVELTGERASGVRYRDRRGREQTARAEREVILAASAIASPQLLMLSGIGRADYLRAVPAISTTPSPARPRSCRPVRVL